MNPLQRASRRVWFMMTAVVLAFVVALFLWSHGIPAADLVAAAALFVGLVTYRAARLRAAWVKRPRSVDGAEILPKPMRWSVGVLLLGLVAISYWLLLHNERQGNSSVLSVCLLCISTVVLGFWSVEQLRRWL